MQVRIPPKKEQRIMVYILGTLDDKIELSRQMDETLEAMARAIFKSWSLVRKEFSKHVGLVMKKIKQQDKETKALTALRDTLLPRLISGELRAPDAEKFMEETDV